MKNTKKIAIMLLLAVVAVGTYFVSGTYAQYTSELTGTANARVAKWAWTFGETAITSASQNTYTFSLFDTVKEADGTTAESHVSTGSGDVHIIAPGTGGSFEIALTNNSEVDATYAIALTETNANNIPIEYSTDGTTWGTAASLNVAATNISKAGGTGTLTVKWRWVFERGTGETLTTNDTADTALGFAANTANSEPKVTVTATVTLTQVD